MQQATPALKRDLGLGQATVLNMIDMVGIGPFTTLPVILLAFPGKFSIIPWLIGAVMSLADGFVWSELGAAWPQAGGSYIFLQKLFKGRLGKMMAFLYSVQTSIHLPLVVTSACMGFVNYSRYLYPSLGFWEGKAVMAGLVILIVALLYRKVISIGKTGVVLSVVVVGMLFWTIITGYLGFDTQLLEANSAIPVKTGNWYEAAFWFAAGSATSKAIYSYLGYYNVCHLGSEIRNPGKNIPRSILISIVGIAILYILMQWVVAGSVPHNKIVNEDTPLISILFEQVYGRQMAQVATGLLLVVAGSSLFALILGYTRIIYASAKEGMHFKIFAHLHPTKNFPDYALLIFGLISIIFCLVFKKPSVVFRFIVVTRIFIQFIPQSVGVLLLRKQRRENELVFKMPLYKLIAPLAILLWLFVFFTSGYAFFLPGLGVLAIGLILWFLIFDKKIRT